jgi:hypothetical protein
MIRSIDELELQGVKFWPSVLAQRERNTSIIPKLIDSQDKFIAILYTADASPTAWKAALKMTLDMPGNLFLKHTIVLTDVGGEKIQRFHADIGKFFPEGEMTFRWKDADYRYRFQSLGLRSRWTNRTLRVTAKGLASPAELSPAMEDVAMHLLHGGASTDPDLPDGLFEKCALGTLIGQKQELDTFVRQRYIHVSRITGGATANAMGQLCQFYVRERLQNMLPDWDLTQRAIPGISQNAGRTDTAFDIVARSPSGKCCAIEVSFQVTTNSVIERKAGQAADRQRVLHNSGHKIAYVIDGAGNFQRRSAISTICAHSDFTVTFKDEELDSLARFLRASD